jgi:hypothetical protein
LSGPPFLNSLLGVTTQKPVAAAAAGSSSLLPAIHPCTVLSSLSMEYWYLSSTSPLNSGSTGSTSRTASLYASGTPRGGSLSAALGMYLWMSSEIAM